MRRIPFLRAVILLAPSCLNERGAKKNAVAQRAVQTEPVKDEEMTKQDGIPQVVFGFNEGSGNVVFVGAAEQATDLTQLLALAPGLTRPAAALTLATALNHFSHGTDYRVIDDVQAYETTYRARVSKEDPEAAWQDGVLRLRDHGIPNFSDINAPSLKDTVLVTSPPTAPSGCPIG